MRDRILSEIKRFVELTGLVPGVKAFENETGILRREWEGKIWARWGDAVKDAGFKPNKLNKRIDTTEILTKVAKCCLELNKLPSSNDLRLYSRQNANFPSSSTIDNHYPLKSLLINALHQFSIDNVEFSRIAEFLPEPQIIDGSDQIGPKIGYVYLIGSGEFYKIGRSNNIERRIKEIKAALPQEAELEHTILTDDPAGIEAYWHRRFDNRRANGEWFKLSKSDILAFKKRKFQ